MSIPRILAIAGSDSGGGAGIQADIRTITMLGGHAMTAVTAITAQNTLGVAGIMPVPAGMVMAQIDAVAGDIGIDAVKIGMVPDLATVHAVGARLLTLPPAVFDPVMLASSGAMLADDDAIHAYVGLARMSALVTPNAIELLRFVGRSIFNADSLSASARILSERLGVPVLAKGGHVAGDDVTDVLIAEGRETRWSDTRIETRHSHGTGCTLSSAIATRLALGDALPDAIAVARAYVRAALIAAPGLGSGSGPMGHSLGRAYFPLEKD